MIFLSPAKFTIKCMEQNLNKILVITNKIPVILSPLRPASLTHKNSHGRKIIDGLRPLGSNDRSRSIDRSKVCFEECPVCAILNMD